MDFDIDQAGKAVAGITSAVSKLIPIVRDWRSEKPVAKDEIASLDDALRDIQKGLDNQTRIAYYFRPLIENYGLASQLNSSIDKVLEYCNENESVLTSTNDQLGEGARRSVAQMLDTLAGYDIKLLKRILSGRFVFLTENDMAQLQKCATAINSDSAALQPLINKEQWQMDMIKDKLKNMRNESLDLKTVLKEDLDLLIDTLAFVRF